MFSSCLGRGGGWCVQTFAGGRRHVPLVLRLAPDDFVHIPGGVQQHEGDVGQRWVRSLNSSSQKKEGKSWEKKGKKRKIKDQKVLSSELWGEKKDRKGIQRNTINKTFNIRKGLSSVFCLILSVLILSDIHIAVTSALRQCTRGFNFSLSCKKS